MTKEEQKLEVSKMVEIEPKYLMGTKAFHQLGEMTMEDYDLFLAEGETDKYWIGAWTISFGFFNALFPKETSRELTQEEIEKYNKTYIQINSQQPIKLDISN